MLEALEKTKKIKTMKVKEAGVKVILFLSEGKLETYEEVDLLYSGENFIRFTDGENIYRYSGSFMVVSKNKNIEDSKEDLKS